MQAQLPIAESDADHEMDRLSQAARFVTHLQLQLAELDRREQQLNEQANAFHAQQVQARRSLQAALAKADQERAELLDRAHQLAEIEETLRQRGQILTQQEENFATRFQQLQEERESLRQRHLADKAALEQETQQKWAELTDAQQKWREEQQQLRAEFLADQERARGEIEKARAEFQNEQQRLREAIAAEQAGALGEVEKLRVDFAAEMEQQRSALEEKRHALQQAHAEERAEWLKQRDAEAAEAALIKSQLQQQVAEQERINQQWAEHRKEEKRQLQASLEEMSRSRFEALDLRERELQQREIDLQKRFRLHEDHLERVRRELTGQRADLEWQEQQQRLWIEQVETSIRMRLAQMRTFRDLLSQRERCLAEEQEVFAQQRRDTEAQLQAQREHLAIERERTAEIREEEIRTHRTRQEQLDQEMNQIERDRDRLNAAMQEFAQLIEQTRTTLTGENPNSLDSHLAQAMSLLSQQILELEDSRKSLMALQQQARNENMRLSGWIQSRDVWVSEREAMFSKQLEELSQRERLCQNERDLWRTERIHVEKVIRDLVQRLEGEQPAAA